MSVLNPKNSLNTGQTADFNRGIQHAAFTVQQRVVSPSYAASSITPVQSENIGLTIPVPSLSSGYGQATATQAFTSIGNVALSPWDTGQVVLHNVSVAAIPATNQLVVSHPEVVLEDAMGNVYPGGMLIPGNNHVGLRARVTVSMIVPTGGSPPANISVNLTGHLHGTATVH